jgi:tRNA(His) 5'-end guanylyltransferase
MQMTTLYLCEHIQGAVLGYTQSDEISIGFIDYQSQQSDAWFDKKVQKMCSIAASMATKAFNWHYTFNQAESNVALDQVDIKDMAEFDARAFVLPQNEVVNYFIWRQQDWTRNSVQMAARAVLSQSKCHKKNCTELQDMLHELGINWNDYSTVEKRGTTIIRVPREIATPDGGTVLRAKWEVDSECPIFTQDREYVSKRFEPAED